MHTGHHASRGCLVALATGASKNLPRDSSGRSGPDSFLVIQQYVNIKKKINLSALMVLQPSVSPLLRAVYSAMQWSPDLAVSVYVALGTAPLVGMGLL